MPPLPAWLRPCLEYLRRDFIGMFEVTRSAAGLRNADMTGKSDPRQITLGRRTHTSEIRYDTLDPVWDGGDSGGTARGSSSADERDLLALPLRVELFDFDQLSFDDSLGETELEVA